VGGNGEPSLTTDYLIAIIAFIAGAAAVYLWYRLRVGVIREHARNELDRWKAECTREIRKDSVSRSRSTLKGRISEQIAPFLPAFPYHHADARFIGNPIDFVVFDGYTQAKDDGQERISIVLVEVKTGKGRLTRAEQLIRKAVEEGRVSWKTVILPDPEGGEEGTGVPPAN
jgi:predicted Holliday junction resolvase-like endonuclease